MERAEGASFRTADTVPGASPTRSATALRVTVPGSLIPDFFLVAISIDDCRVVNCGRLRLAHASGECNFNPEIYDQHATRRKTVSVHHVLIPAHTYRTARPWPQGFS